MQITGALLGVLLAIVSSACGGPPPAAREEPPEIGLVLDTLREERWQRDRDLFIARADELGLKVAARSADGDAARQMAAATELLDAGVKVLVVVPTDLEKAGEIVAAAAARTVPVVSYDRLIRNADVALYVSFDNVKVGRMQAEAMLQARPKGTFVLLGGSPTDNNARLVRDGQMTVLEPAIASKAIRVVADPWVEGWDPAVAEQKMADVLKKTRRVDAVVASNDSTASGAIAALAAVGLAGRVAVSGQDADLAACRRIVQGTQTMTVYKPLKPLARMAAGAAASLVKGESIDSLVRVNNGLKEVPARLLDPIAVDKSNIDLTVISDGYHSREDIYQLMSN